MPTGNEYEPGVASGEISTITVNFAVPPAFITSEVNPTATTSLLGVTSGPLRKMRASTPKISHIN